MLTSIVAVYIAMWLLLTVVYYMLHVHIGVVAILTSAAEFNPHMSQVIKARPSDNDDLTEVWGLYSNR